MFNLLLKTFGQIFTVLICDPATFDRWLWLKHNLSKGSFRTLDAGCGSGAFTIYSAEMGNEAIGISFDVRNNKVARERAQVLGIKNIKFIDENLGKLDEMAKVLGKFDQVICFEAIEHIIDDNKLLQNFYNLLKPGGRLLITTPYRYYRHFPGEYISEIEDGSHVRRGYTFEDMRSILNKAGFEVKKEEYITGFISQYLCRILKFFNALYPNLGWFLTFPFRILQIFDRPVTNVLKYPALSVCVVAKKI